MTLLTPFSILLQKQMFRFVICLFIMLQYGCTTNNERQEHTNQVTLDLSNWDSVKTPELNISGNLLFYWKQLPIDNNKSFDSSQLKNPDTISWASPIWTKKEYEGKGYGTYRFFIKRKDIKTPLILKMYRVLGASELWINGKKSKSLGRVSKNEIEEKIDGRPLRVELPNKEYIDVMLLISNHKHRLGGGFLIKNTIETATSFTNRNAVKSFLEGGTTLLILLFGVYQILTFISFPKNTYFLYLGLFCILAGSRQLFIGEAFIYSFFLEVPFELVQKIRYIGYYGGLTAIFMYHITLFPGYFSSKFIRLNLTFSIIGILYVIVVPTFYGTYSAPVFQIYGLMVILMGFYQIAQAIRDKKPYAIGMLINMSIACLLLVNDLLNAMLVLQTGFFINLGVLLYICFQVIINNKIQKETKKELLKLSLDIENMSSHINTKEEEILKLLSESYQQAKSKEKLVENLKKVASENDTISIKSIITDLKSELLEDSKLAIIKRDIEELNYAFLKRIKTVHPNLTKTDLEICSYLRLSLGRKEIAKLRFTSPEAVKKSRNRLRKKMDLSLDDDLEVYIKSI